VPGCLVLSAAWAGALLALAALVRLPRGHLVGLPTGAALGGGPVGGTIVAAALRPRPGLPCPRTRLLFAGVTVFVALTTWVSLWAHRPSGGDESEPGRQTTPDR
jgi:hypothetical protein